MNRTACVLLLSGIAALVGCGDDDETGPPDPMEGDLFAVCASLIGPVPSTYVALLNSLDGDQVIDLPSAFDVPLGACASGLGSLFIGSQESPEITRYDVIDGQLTAGLTVSFANSGVRSIQSFEGLLTIVSPSKAYYIDSAQNLVVVWNPTDMVVLDDIPIDGLQAPAGLEFVNLGGAVRAGDQIVAFGRYRNAREVTVSRTALAFINVNTDEVTVDTTDDCGGISGYTIASTGDIYFASNNISAAGYRLGQEGSFAPCLIRVPAGATEIDDNLSFALNDLTGGMPTGGIVQGRGDAAFILAYDENEVAIDPSASARDVQSAAAWRLYRIPDIQENLPAVRIDSFPPSSGALLSGFIDDRTFLIQLAEDFSNGQLFEVTAQGEVTASVQAPGIPLFVVQIR